MDPARIKYDDEDLVDVLLRSSDAFSHQPLQSSGTMIPDRFVGRYGPRPLGSSAVFGGRLLRCSAASVCVCFGPRMDTAEYATLFHTSSNVAATHPERRGAENKEKKEASKGPRSESRSVDPGDESGSLSQHEALARAGKT